MITIYDRPPAGTGLAQAPAPSAIGPATVWIDLVTPTEAEESLVEHALGIEVPTRAEMREIEASSRFYAENGAVYMTAAIVYDIEGPSPKGTVVTFILAGDRLVTVRYAEPKAFPIFVARADKGGADCTSGASVMIGLVETLIARNADLIERLQDEAERLAGQLFDIKGGSASRNRRLDVVLKATGKLGSGAGLAEESAVSMALLLNYFHQSLRSRHEQHPVIERIEDARADVASLTEHLRFLTSRTGFLLSATLGTINIEQNQIIKLFSVVAVLLMPPTLIASIYGMNFRHMPELHLPLGYPVALGLMLASALLSFLYFKRKGWL